MSFCKIVSDSLGSKVGDVESCPECIPEVMEVYTGDISNNIVQKAAYKRCLEADTWMQQQRNKGNKVTREDGLRWAKRDPEAFRALVMQKANDDLKVNGEMRHSPLCSSSSV